MTVYKIKDRLSERFKKTVLFFFFKCLFLNILRLWSSDVTVNIL